MKDLIASLEAATKGSRELDAEIFAAISDDRTIRLGDGAAPGCYWQLSVGGRSLHTAPIYTTSLDAALRLVPEGYDWWTVDGFADGQGCASCYKKGIGGDLYNGSTPALALCIAALKARAT